MVARPGIAVRSAALAPSYIHQAHLFSFGMAFAILAMAAVLAGGVLGFVL